MLNKEEKWTDSYWVCDFSLILPFYYLIVIIIITSYNEAKHSNTVEEAIAAGVGLLFYLNFLKISFPQPCFKQKKVVKHGTSSSKGQKCGLEFGYLPLANMSIRRDFTFKV